MERSRASHVVGMIVGCQISLVVRVGYLLLKLFIEWTLEGVCSHYFSCQGQILYTSTTQNSSLVTQACFWPCTSMKRQSTLQPSCNTNCQVPMLRWDFLLWHHCIVVVWGFVPQLDSSRRWRRWAPATLLYAIRSRWYQWLYNNHNNKSSPSHHHVYGWYRPSKMGWFIIWLVVTGTWLYEFPFSWEFHHPTDELHHFAEG